MVDLDYQSMISKEVLSPDFCQLLEHKVLRRHEWNQEHYQKNITAFDKLRTQFSNNNIFLPPLQHIFSLFSWIKDV
jgi:hypothetical protein